MSISQKRRDSISRAYGFRVINTSTKALTSEELAFEVKLRKLLLSSIGMTDTKAPDRPATRRLKSLSIRRRG